ncbi:MAG TPA: hypothetical protein PLY93_06025, partial [Turneriella sp.]|nr:hypothetical protein [Turneriella sp.]
MTIELLVFFALVGLILCTLFFLFLRKKEAQVRRFRREIFLKKTALKGAAFAQLLKAENTQLIAHGIDQSALFVRGGHRLVSDVTFGLMRLIPATREQARAAKDVHDFISDSLYGALRIINEQIGGSIAQNIKMVKPKVKTKTTKIKKNSKNN